MSTMEKKKNLRKKYLKPKVKLRRIRNSKEISQEYMGAVIGISREQYAKKENGEFAFQDYEMELIAKELGSDVGSIFYEN